MLRISAPAPPDGPPVTVAVDGSSFAAPDGAAVELPEGWAITAGLIDLQVNGLEGLFPVVDPASLPALDRELAARGVAGYLVAVPSGDPEQVRALADAAEAFAAEPGSGLLGLHLEGPVLAPEYRGAHREEQLRPGDDPEALALLDLPGVRLVTVAPEVPGALAYARAAQDRGIVVAAGHTGATAEQAREAIDAGIRLVTHVFNAMTPVHQRAPGLRWPTCSIRTLASRSSPTASTCTTTWSSSSSPPLRTVACWSATSRPTTGWTRITTGWPGRRPRSPTGFAAWRPSTGWASRRPSAWPASVRPRCSGTRTAGGSSPGRGPT